MSYLFVDGFDFEGKDLVHFACYEKGYNTNDMQFICLYPLFLLSTILIHDIDAIKVRRMIEIVHGYNFYHPI